MITVSQTRDPRLLAELNAEVQNLHVQLYPGLFKPYHKESMVAAMEKFIDDSTNRFYIATKNGTPIGSALFMIKDIQENAFHYAFKTLHIDQISVLKEHRRSGAGLLLLNQAEKLAAELGIHRLELDHWASNSVAGAYFKKMGYQTAKKRLYKLI